MNGRERLLRHLVEQHYVRPGEDPWEWAQHASAHALLDFHNDDHEQHPDGWYPRRLPMNAKRCKHRHSARGLKAIYRAIFMDESHDVTRC